MKKRTRRAKSKFPALKKKYTLKIRQDLLDYDYIDKLSDEEKAYLNQFTEEWLNASFVKTKSGNYSSKNLHKTQAQRREAYSRNNRRNNDVYSIAKTSNKLGDSREVVRELESHSKNVEDDLIDILDIKKP